MVFLVICLDAEYSAEITAIILCGIFALSVLVPRMVDYRTTMKRNIILSTISMAISLIVLGAHCHYQGSYGHAFTEDSRQLPIICLSLFYFFFAIGPFRMVITFVDDVLPQKSYFTIRCLLTSTSWLVIYGITRVLPHLIDSIGVGWLFWYMAFMCMFMVIFVKLFMPEIEQLTKEEKLVESSESFSDASI